MPHSQNNLAFTSPVYPPLQHYSSEARFSWSAESRHLFSWRTLNLVWWPLFCHRQRFFTRSPLFRSCRKLPGFLPLWKTIQKGSFAYNCLLLRLTPFKQKPATHLADITTLALFFGDEFIDGIALSAGKPFVRELTRNNPERFFLKIKRTKHRVFLKYCFDLGRLLPAGMHQLVNPRYGITYDYFHRLLHDFLDQMNKELGKLPFEKAEKTAVRIADACNTCFRSFLHDVSSSQSAGTLPTPAAILDAHEMKTAYMQTKLLELRCTLADKEEAMTSSQTAGWLDIMRVIQIYDDIHDIRVDLGMQDNLLLSVAYHFFPAEWEWFTGRQRGTEFPDQQPVLFSLFMPCSMEYCFRLAAARIRTMNWEQQKIMHYLLFKNKYCLYSGDHHAGISMQKNFLLPFYESIKDRMPQLPAASVKSFAIDTCIHLPGVRQQLLRKTSWAEAYQLRFNLHSLPVEFKTAIFDKVTAT